MLGAPLFYVLLALRDRDRHGYEILKEVQAGSLGKIRMGPATLYTSLKKLLMAHLVQEVSRPRDADARRRYYRLTGKGRTALDNEVDRMETAVMIARRKAAPST